MSALTSAARPWVAGLASYEAGRPIEEVARELGFDPADVVKLASNENALGPSPRALAALQAALGRAHIYPDGDAFYLRRGLAQRLGVAPEEVFIGHGSNEIIALLGHVYLGPGTNIVMSDRAFVVYKLVAALYQAEVRAVPMRGFTHDLDAMRAAITPETRLVFVANPNNPTGTRVDNAALDRFLEQLPPHVVAVLDEAYVELLPPAEQPDLLRHVRAGRPIYILRTFSKTYGLAGLRVGYALAGREGVALLNRVRQPFNVNALALEAALAALDDDDYLQRTRALVAAGLAQLEEGFRSLGLDYVPSCANFILVRVGRGREVFQRLRERKVIVRPMDGYGLPDHIRVTVGTADENARFLAALTAVLRA